MLHRLSSVVLASTLAAVTLLTVPALSFAGPRHTPGWRTHHQQARIYQGVRQGQIGPREYRHLERQQWRTNRMRHRFRHNDGSIGPRERARLQHRLNHTSRSIYRARHN
ncbi:MAG: hypothetical protein FJ147_03105 [Deltaproteobacteria bacterium]|nr:hypothetical protein [Deltaproteobacteria bacterium]